MEHERGDRLLQAARAGQEGRVRRYLQQGLDANYQDADGNTALHKASVQKKSFGALFLLLRLTDVDVNKRNLGKETALIVAARNGNYSAVRSLLQHKANVKCEDKWRCNALDYASEYSYKQIVRALEEAGACRTGNKRRAISLVRPMAHHDTPETMFRRLLQDPNVNITDKQLANVLRASNITDSLQFSSANYLALILRRARHPVMDWFCDFRQSNDYLLENVYFRAAHLRLTDEERLLTKLMIQNAEARGLIRPGFGVVAKELMNVNSNVRKRLDKLQKVTDKLLGAYSDLQKRIGANEKLCQDKFEMLHELANYVGEVVEDVNRMREGFNGLYRSLRGKDKLEGIIGIVRCVLLLMPVVGPFFEMAFLSAELFFGCISQINSRGSNLTKGRRSLGLGVDLSDSTSIGILAGEEFRSKLSQRSRRLFEFAVKESQFRSCGNLRKQLESSDF